MSHTKPTIEQETILTLLNKQFGKAISSLEPIQTGHMSRSYSFTADGKDYILRFNPSSESFEKDAYAYNHYASTSIPIPRIVTIGRVEKLAYAISERLPGTMLNFMSDAEYRKVIPSILEVLDAIHHVDVSNQPHYGYVNAKGIGQSASWRQRIVSIYEENPEDFYGHWHTLFQNSFLERSVFDSVYQKMLGLLDYCPEERYLLHGDYGFDNVLAHEGKITAVLDWALSQYGDFLYDTAYLHYFSYQYGFLELFREFYANKNRSIPFYDERMMCYTCFIGLNAMKFFAMAQLQQEYTWARERILSLLANASV
jgi:hygromycin-B 4-O-kinase